MPVAAEIIRGVDPVPIQEAAKEFGLNPDTLYRWIGEGQIKRIRMDGDRRTFVDRNEVRAKRRFRVEPPKPKS